MQSRFAFRISAVSLEFIITGGKFILISLNIKMLLRWERYFVIFEVDGFAVMLQLRGKGAGVD
jgi:hypothetical protein